jgi:hypothetical protein
MDAQEVAARQAEGSVAITARMGRSCCLWPFPCSCLRSTSIPTAKTLWSSLQSSRNTPTATSGPPSTSPSTSGSSCSWGLVALYYSLSPRPGAGAGLAPFGLAAAVTTAACFTVLQAVDGIALKRAVDAWASAPASEKAAAFAAAEAIRWSEVRMNGLSFFLAGLTLFLFGSAIALGSVYPRWIGLITAISGAAFIYDGIGVVAYEGFVPSTIKLVGLLLLAAWAFAMAPLMWRNGGR